MAATSSTNTTIISLLIATIAVLLGLFCFTEIPTQLFLYRGLAYLLPPLTGLTPAYSYGIPWGFTFDDLQQRSPLLSGEFALVTGANSGIGYALVELLTQHSTKHITMACRNPTKCEAAKRRIQSKFPNSPTILHTMTLDTSSLQSVKAFAISYQRYRTQQQQQQQQHQQDDSLSHPSLHMLFLNAGRLCLNPHNKKCVPANSDGVEEIFATNYLGHHLLYRLLEPFLDRAQPAARVVSTSSAASYPPSTYSYQLATDLATLNGCREPYRSRFTGLDLSYGQSKLAQIVWSRHVTSHRLPPDSSIYVNAFHPGAVATEIWDKHIPQYTQQHPLGARLLNYAQGKTDDDDGSSKNNNNSGLMWNIYEGALTGLYLGTMAHVDNVRGQYYHVPTVHMAPNPIANDATVQQQLWDFSEELVRDYIKEEEEEEK